MSSNGLSSHLRLILVTFMGYLRFEGGGVDTLFIPKLLVCLDEIFCWYHPSLSFSSYAQLIISCHQFGIIRRLIPAQILLVPSVTALEEGRFWSVMDVCPVRYRTGEGLTMVSYEYMSRPLHPSPESNPNSPSPVITMVSHIYPVRYIPKMYPKIPKMYPKIPKMSFHPFRCYFKGKGSRM